MSLYAPLALFVLVHLSLGSVAFAAPDQSTRRLASVFEEIREEEVSSTEETSEIKGEGQESPKLERATFGTGCFWCTEAVFEELRGVRNVASGYSGGRFPNPTYEQVCTGLTGHAEVVHLEFDPTEISYVRLLEVFWRTHDPTTLNRQGLDVGSQYRSAIFYHNDQQRDLAEQIKRRLNQEHAFRDPIVTEITKFENFYVAKGYHQDYFAKNGRQPYCRRIIRPKLAKFRRIFKEDLKRNSRATTSTK